MYERRTNGNGKLASSLISVLLISHPAYLSLSNVNLVRFRYTPFSLFLVLITSILFKQYKFGNGRSWRGAGALIHLGKRRARSTKQHFQSFWVLLLYVKHSYVCAPLRCDSFIIDACHMNVTRVEEVTNGTKEKGREFKPLRGLTCTMWI